VRGKSPGLKSTTLTTRHQRSKNKEHNKGYLPLWRMQYRSMRNSCSQTGRQTTWL
jgi:hypothetical protein